MAYTTPNTFSPGANSQFLVQLNTNWSYIVTVVNAGN